MTLRKSSSSTKKAASLAMTDFEVGQKVTATVKKVEEYGLFLKIDGSDVSGLCHKSEVCPFSASADHRLMGRFPTTRSEMCPKPWLVSEKVMRSEQRSSRSTLKRAR
jgi:polyribonucleotide nucleotidyltransferase